MPEMVSILTCSKLTRTDARFWPYYHKAQAKPWRTHSKLQVLWYQQARSGSLQPRLLFAYTVPSQIWLFITYGITTRCRMKEVVSFSRPGMNLTFSESFTLSGSPSWSIGSAITW